MPINPRELHEAHEIIRSWYRDNRFSSMDEDELLETYDYIDNIWRRYIEEWTLDEYEEWPEESWVELEAIVEMAPEVMTELNGYLPLIVPKSFWEEDAS